MLTREVFWPSIAALDGRELKTLERGRPFEVRDVRQDRVVVTPAVSGTRRTIRRGTLEGAFNALLDVDQAACVALNARDLIIERGADRRVAVVGHFPFVEQIRRAAARCWVLEITPRPGDIPAERADEVLPQADVVALTGTSLINHTFEDVMTHCRPDAFVLVLGASAPLTPLLFESGVDAVCGTYVVDPERVLPLVAQGATFRQIRRGGGIRLLTMMNEEMT